MRTSTGTRDRDGRANFARMGLALLAVAATMGCGTTVEVPEVTSTWVVIRNDWAGGGHHVTGHSGPFIRYPWTGILFQLGDFKDVHGSPYSTLRNIAVGDSVYAPAPDTVYWINVVSERAIAANVANKKEPMEQTHAVDLFPNGRPGSNEAGSETAESIHFPCYIAGDPNCRCSRRLHPLMDPRVVMTVWFGKRGYTVTTGDDGNNYEFKVKGKVAVQVYRITNLASANPTFQLVGDFPTGSHKIKAVGSIAYQHKENIDPPWP